MILDRVELPGVVAVAVATAVGVTAGPIVSIVVRMCVTCACIIAGLSPLSGYT